MWRFGNSSSSITSSDLRDVVLFDDSRDFVLLHEVATDDVLSDSFLLEATLAVGERFLRPRSCCFRVHAEAIGGLCDRIFVILLRHGEVLRHSFQIPNPPPPPMLRESGTRARAGLCVAE